MAPTKPCPRWAWVIVAAALAVHVLMLASLEGRTLNRVFNDTYNRPGPGADFFAVYHAGRQVLTGRDPYRASEQPRITPDFAPFRYTPGVAFTFGAAIANVKPWLAYWGWVIVLEALFWVSLLLLRRRFDDVKIANLVTAAWLIFTPFYVELWMGQFTFAVASMVFIALLAWRSGRNKLAAGLWAAAVTMKIFPLVLVPMLVRQRRYLALLVGLAGLALSLLWFAWHPDAWEIFWRLNFTELDLASFHAGNFGLQAFLYDVIAWLGRPLSPGEWRPIATLLSAALVLVTTLAMVRRSDADARISVAMGLLLLVLLSKHVWEHHYVVALPALTLLAWTWQRQPRRLLGLAAAYLLICMPSPLALWQSGAPAWYPEREWTPLMRAAYHAPKPLTALAVFGYCVRIQLRARG